MRFTSSLLWCYGSWDLLVGEWASKTIIDCIQTSSPRVSYIQICRLFVGSHDDHRLIFMWEVFDLKGVCGGTWKADPRMEKSRIVWARDGGSCRGRGTIFPGLPALLCCICPAGFRSLGTLVDCGSPPTSALCFSFPRVMVNGKCLEGGLLAVFKTLLWGAVGALSFL